jgi:hypothetical protein
MTQDLITGAEILVWLAAEHAYYVEVVECECHPENVGVVEPQQQSLNWLQLLREIVSALEPLPNADTAALSSAVTALQAATVNLQALQAKGE